MKFARYLEDTQIPEWKRAYIDFKGLKKRIAAIRETKLLLRFNNILEPFGTIAQSYGHTDHIPYLPPIPSLGLGLFQLYSSTDSLSLDEGKERNGSIYGQHRSISEATIQKPFGGVVAEGLVERGYTSWLLGRGRCSKIVSNSHTTVESLYASLAPVESYFFTYLDHELQKVDQFYAARETAAFVRLSELKDQLRELSDHRNLFYEVQSRQNDHWKLPKVLGDALGVSSNPLRWEPRWEPSSDIHHTIEKGESSADISTYERPVRDPSEYHHAKRKLKLAIREFYRSLELLNDYRVLNLTGFRKALKKYDKVTKRSSQDLYTREKIDFCRFSYSRAMDDTMRDVENIYAARFGNGDRKKAREKLRSPFQSKSHYFSMFRSGVYLGLAIPALVCGIYNSFQPQIRTAIPEWGALLQIYATLMIFVVFSLLLGINIIAWTHNRINFAFIFELDVRSAINIQKYFELPTFLFGTLCCALWLSFSLIGSDNLAPTTWPIIWIIFVIIVMINPLPIFSRDSRYWLIHRISRLLIAGTSPVGFTDFWLGDQFCSLAFSLEYFYVIGCAYFYRWDSVLSHCGASTHWGPLMLVVTPYVSRLVQSLRRYYDSRLLSHLINGGKYFSSVITYATYYIWQSRGSQYDITFGAWLVFATISSIYGSLWDLLMDWSFLERDSSRGILRSRLIYSNNSFIYYFAIVTNILLRFNWVMYIPAGGLNPQVRSAIVAGLEMLRRFQWNFYRLENEQIGNADQYRASREVPLPYSCMRRTEYDDDDNSIKHQPNANGGAAPGVNRRKGSFWLSKLLGRDSY